MSAGVTEKQTLFDSSLSNNVGYMPCGRTIQWLSHHPLVSFSLFISSTCLVFLLLMTVDISLSNKLTLGLITGSVLAITFLPLSFTHPKSRRLEVVVPTLAVTKPATGAVDSKKSA